ncbi:hypothetical protein SAMN05421797_101715 [Maribacter ulvicola]|uniref:Uncharacterized protein n=1 Tax=Maribacter ulvicola TaxID=228959 RepID=A0A1N6Q333_9FLAO|nr:hypothetical protein SAMN05421797_101715 [Maribacter ulvicola]
MHIKLLKKYDNATKVTIDFYRHRIKMEVTEDDSLNNPKKVNTYLPTFYTNLLFNNLCKFLNLCVEKEPKSIDFYSRLLRTFKRPNKRLFFDANI